MTEDEVRPETPAMETLAGTWAAFGAAFIAGLERMRPTLEKLSEAVRSLEEDKKRHQTPFWAVNPTKSRRR